VGTLPWQNEAARYTTTARETAGMVLACCTAWMAGISKDRYLYNRRVRDWQNRMAFHILLPTIFA
jgi:hypothetical protein